MDNQKQPKKQVLWIVVMVVVLALVAYGVWIAISGKKENTNNSSNTNTVASVNTNNTVNTNLNIIFDPATGWNTYTNNKYDYTIEYPKGWNVKQFDYDYEFNNEAEGVLSASVANFTWEINSYNPKSNEINIDIEYYKNSQQSIKDWYQNMIKVNRRDRYQKVTLTDTIIDEKNALIEEIITGSKPQVPVDTEWLDGKIINAYVLYKPDRVMGLSAITLINSVNLFEDGMKVIKSIKFAN